MAQKNEKLHPDHFYRLAEGPKFFGYGPTQIAERIKSGDIPMPASLSDTGRAKGWFGQTIIDWQNERKEEAREKEEKQRREREEMAVAREKEGKLLREREEKAVAAENREKQTRAKMEGVMMVEYKSSSPAAVLTEAEQAIAQVKAAMPLLCGQGMLTQPNERECSGFSVDGVTTAIAFLRQCQKQQKPCLNSYGLKHVAERWGYRHSMEPYVSNGELIVAAVFLGFDIEWDGCGPNLLVAVSRKDVRRLNNDPSITASS